MQFEVFLGQVQNRARLGSLAEAERAARATLEILAERLTATETDHLAAQLPEGIAHYLRYRQEVVERLEPQEFLRRISEREGVDLPAAIFHARAVLDVLGEAVSRGQMDHIRAQLPEEFGRLFEAGSAGHLPRES